jgi:transcriptional regulator with XRE-family HTH domain
MIDGQWRAARALIGWSQGELAEKIGASVLTIKRLEAGGHSVSDDMRTRAKEALEAAGVIFVEENGEGPGVRLRKAKPAFSDEDAIPPIPEDDPYDGSPV